MAAACRNLHGILLFHAKPVFSLCDVVSHSAPDHEFVIACAHAIRTALWYAGLNGGIEPHVNRISKSIEYDHLVD